VRAHVEDAGEEIEPAADVKHRMSLSHVSQPLEYVLAMLRHHRPEFDDLSHRDQIALIEDMCGYINAFLESLRTLQAFLAHGAPNRKLTPAIMDPRRDVKAAVLCDVVG
jgi:hypothetical protein